MSNGNELLDLRDVKVDTSWAMRVPATLAVRRQVLAFSLVDDSVCVAYAKQPDVGCTSALQKHLGRQIRFFQAEPNSLRESLNRIYSGPRESRSNGDEGETAVALSDELLNAAIMQEASDLHIDPEASETLVRLRVDGVLHDYHPIPSSSLSGLISRFKVLAGMDIAEKRAPQDGHFRHDLSDGKHVDIRVASLPTRYGERMTLRFLATKTESLTLERLGMSDGDLDTVSDVLQRPHGLVLITGPTGSGKSTTLYAALRHLLSQGAYNVITIEDPIEYEIPRVGQVEVDSADKVSFAKALRSVLRHDPDVVMIGEIRDHETADVAIKSALTGHLVFSTVHTNSAASAITRLADMDIHRFLIGATIRLSVAQRLVRRLCQKCRQPRPLTETEALAINQPEATGSEVFDAVGCHYCANHGYVGRVGLFEILNIDPELSRLISKGADEVDLASAAQERGMKQLAADGLTKMLSGLTSPQEVLSAVSIW